MAQHAMLHLSPCSEPLPIQREQCMLGMDSSETCPPPLQSGACWEGMSLKLVPCPSKKEGVCNLSRLCSTQAPSNLLEALALDYPGRGLQVRTATERGPASLRRPCWTRSQRPDQ